MTRRRSATLRDVATRAGVSRTTASYILNGRADEMRIAASTERKVQAAVADLGYRPNRSARSLRTPADRDDRADLRPDRRRAVRAASMLTGASVAARELDHLLVIGESGGDPDLERLLIEEMLERAGRRDGLRHPHRARDPAAARPARRARRSCSTARHRDERLPAVVPDDEGGGRAAAAVLLAAGVERRRAWSARTRPARRRPGRARMAGIRAELATRGDRGRRHRRVRLVGARGLRGRLAAGWRPAAARPA